MLKLDAISLILTHHTAEYFTFLENPANARARTAFYHTLARLLFMEDSPTRFKSFVAPLHQVVIRGCIVS
jgi:exportin-7